MSIKSGAIDYLTKPIHGEALEIAVRQALEVVRLRRENETFRREILKVRGQRALIGDSEAFRRTMEVVSVVAPSRATVLLQGESGTGKELFARAIHDQSPRSDGPFITVNCAALPEGLVESAPSSGMRRAPSPGPRCGPPAPSSGPTAARCCWTRSPRCVSTSSPSCSA
ncbi:MAG: sigma 54-interacting transcriptional regulator, partial [Chloroflexota bacterium]|nr:sigma 54-interacting transcriptional regulator [Chloroflexota bacterium]